VETRLPVFTYFEIPQRTETPLTSRLSLKKEITQRKTTRNAPPRRTGILIVLTQKEKM
jgi:hypothetical protein